MQVHGLRTDPSVITHHIYWLSLHMTCFNMTSKYTFGKKPRKVILSWRAIKLGSIWQEAPKSGWMMMMLEILSWGAIKLKCIRLAEAENTTTTHQSNKARIYLARSPKSGWMMMMMLEILSWGAIKLRINKIWQKPQKDNWWWIQKSRFIGYAETTHAWIIKCKCTVWGRIPAS